MTKEKLVALFKFYHSPSVFDQRLNHEDNEIQMGAQSRWLVVAAHLNWMCKAAEELVAEDRIEKAMRWLGFIQGVLFAVGRYSIDDLKEHSRPDSRVVPESPVVLVNDGCV